VDFSKDLIWLGIKLGKNYSILKFSKKFSSSFQLSLRFAKIDNHDQIEGKYFFWIIKAWGQQRFMRSEVRINASFFWRN